MSNAYGMKYNMNMDVDTATAKAVESIGTMKKRVQQALISHIRHLSISAGDYSKANELVEALGNGVNKKAAVEFLIKFGGLLADKEGFCGWQGKEYIKANWETAKQTEWHSFAQQQEFGGYDLGDVLRKALKGALAMEKRAEKDDEAAEKISIDPALLAGLETLIAPKAA